MSTPLSGIPKTVSTSDTWIFKRAPLPIEMQQNLVSTCASIHTHQQTCQSGPPRVICRKCQTQTDYTSSICFGLNKEITLRSSLTFSGKPKEQRVRVTFGALGAPMGSARNSLLFPRGEGFPDCNTRRRPTGEAVHGEEAFPKCQISCTRGSLSRVPCSLTETI
jgi:hypothetical protein